MMKDLQGAYCLLLFTSVCFLPGASSYRDDTLENRTVGMEIVGAVIRRIRSSEIFPEDYSFLLRIAYVESKFGLHKDTFRAGYYGGIWQVDEDKFEATKAPKNESLAFLLKPIHDQVFHYFGINWTTVEWKELLKPFYSGLAARIYIFTMTKIVNASIPDTIKRQEDHWLTFYRPERGDEETGRFTEDSKLLEMKTCRPKLDLLIGVDGSTSVTAEKFKVLLDNVGDMITKTFRLGLVNTRIGIYIWSNRVFHLLGIENNHPPEKMKEILQGRKESFPYGDTRVDVALRYGLQNLKNATETGKGVPQVILLFMEGQSDAPVSDVIDQLTKENVSTIVVGVGRDVDHDELLEIGVGEKKNVFTLLEFDSMPDFLFRMAEVLCTIPLGPFHIGETYSDTLWQNESRTYILEIENNEGITVGVVVENEEGIVRGFWSFTDEIPREFVNDGEIDSDGKTFIPSRSDDGSHATGRTSIKARSMRVKTTVENDDNEFGPFPTFPQRVYLTIEGLSGSSTYKIKIEEGNQDHQDIGSGGGAALNYNSIYYFVIYLILISM